MSEPGHVDEEGFQEPPEPEEDQLQTQVDQVEALISSLSDEDLKMQTTTTFSVKSTSNLRTCT